VACAVSAALDSMPLLKEVSFESLPEFTGRMPLWTHTKEHEIACALLSTGAWKRHVELAAEL